MEFKKGDYIVTLVDDGYCGRRNYCVKQYINSSYLNPILDTAGNTGNGNLSFQANNNCNWRYATPEEAAE